MPRFKCSLILLASLIGAPGLVSAQMVTTQSPLQGNSSSFYEHSHVGWSVHNPHYFMNFNGGGGAPPFGGYQPNAGLHGGFGLNNTAFDFGFGQGASVNSVSATPVLTTTNGFPGYLFIGSERPFVTGVVPVVGGGFASVPPMGPLASRVATGQLRTEQGRIVRPEQDQVPVAAPRQAAIVRPAVRDEIAQAPRPAAVSSGAAEPSVEDYLEKGAAAEKAGRLGAAKIYYQLAATKGSVFAKAEAGRRLEALKRSSTDK